MFLIDFQIVFSWNNLKIYIIFPLVYEKQRRYTWYITLGYFKFFKETIMNKNVLVKYSIKLKVLCQNVP